MLKSIKYSEHAGGPAQWLFEECDFQQVNLIVGRNATGKSRLIRLISGLCGVLAGTRKSRINHGSFEAVIELEGVEYCLQLETGNNRIIRELLVVDGAIRLTRDADGAGEIWYHAEQSTIAFQMPPDVFAFQQRHDKLQHPFIVALAEWAERGKTYLFSSHLGRETFVLQSGLGGPLNLQEPDFETGCDLVHAYASAFDKFQEPFDLAILADMKDIGFNLTAIHAADVRSSLGGGNYPEPVIGLVVTERGQDINITQANISNGMFRALALVIYANISKFEKARTMMLVDDVGEGLDYERSTGLIDVLIRHAQETNFQLLMTSNDRFVMNRVPIKHWVLLEREGGTVHSITERKNPNAFEDFRMMGLSNFEFFKSTKLH